MKNWKLLISFLIITIISNQLVFAANHSLTEVQIKNSINSQQTSALNLLEKLVNINSGTQNIAGVHQVGEIVREQFNQLGFKTHWIEEPPSMKRAGILIAEHTGASPSNILLIGHLDTVFSQDSSFKKFTRHGSLITGPGIIDDKGGVVVILYALKALQAAQALNGANITVILTGDEEDSGKPTSISRRPLVEAAKKSDIALEFEWSMDLNSAVVARRGISAWTIETHGNEAHSSKIFQPSVGDGAIFELSRILHMMRTEFAAEKYLTFNPGIILGGNTASLNDINQGSAQGLETKVAKIAVVKGDVRFISNYQKQAFEKKLTEIVAQHLPGTRSTIHFQDQIPAMSPSTNNLALLKQYSQVSIDLGYGPVLEFDPKLRGASDISHIAQLVPANLGGLGPYGTGAHSEQETLDIHSLAIATQRTAVLINRIIKN